MSIELKIKAKSLAAEARIIKDEAAKLKKRARKASIKQKSEVAQNLRALARNIKDHNKFVVRKEARATHLARAYLKGQPYSRVEGKITTAGLYDRPLSRIVKMAQKYGDSSTTAEDIKRWFES